MAESVQQLNIQLSTPKAVELSAKGVKQRLPDEVISNYPIPDALGRTQEMLIVNEYGIYETVFESRKKEAESTLSRQEEGEM